MDTKVRFSADAQQSPASAVAVGVSLFQGLHIDPTCKKVSAEIDRCIRRQIHERRPLSRARILAAKRQIFDAIQRRNATGATEGTPRHMNDCQRGFTMAGLDMSPLIVLPQ